MNETLQQIHATLLAQHNALAATLDNITDVDKAKVIVMEMQEILHRIDLVQNLLFTESAQELKATLPNIKKANDQLSKSVQSIDDVAQFLASSANFLKAVDQAIDLAKALAV